jgi:hypothetical protein
MRNECSSGRESIGYGCLTPEAVAPAPLPVGMESGSGKRTSVASQKCCK